MKNRIRHIAGRLWLVVLGVALFALSGCQAAANNPDPAAIDPAKAFSAITRAQGGWKLDGEIKSYTKDTLFDLMDGQSDAYFVYGFQKADVQRFQGAAGVQLIVQIYQVDSPESAYGLFTANRDPQPLAVGNDGSTSEGQHIVFWQNRCFITLTALKKISQADLAGAATALAESLPKGGAAPALMTSLPADGLATNPAPVFFHQELTIQDRVFLGGENKLELGLDTNAVLAQYTLGGKSAWLILIEYPDAKRAERAQQALPTAGITGYTASKVRNLFLAAVVGTADVAAAQALIDQALR